MTSAVITSPTRISLRARLSSNSAAKFSVVAVAWTGAFIIQIQYVGCSVKRRRGLVDKAVSRSADHGALSACLRCLLIERQHLRHRVRRRHPRGIDQDGVHALLQGGRRAPAVALVALADIL